MSREIKFRAWIKTGNETDDYVEPMTIQQMIHSKESTFSLEQLNDLVDLEQFTGLKDKNGKDIYEGDILAWHSNIYRKHDWVGVVLYRGAGFAVQESDRSYSSPEWLECACRKDANIIEVIGNIHEDEDLLEENWRQTNER
ncbi:YopX family protein [Lentilactobacillus kefiri]|uniref:YopX family protein n=1 Tax=Lentilactobacillus kefiri TaxID=33962 RepID=UPI001FB32EAF|nr:YopX family protein [Lentilactobacillus kefiri]MCJ2161923.1 YopX family protein [Lentilactobacillus kefiri]UOD77581.1 YopX family protein [Lentilactobacillus kefiri]